MRFTLFDDDDLKKIEDTMARALARALRTVLREGLIQGYTPPKPETFAEAHPAPAPVTAPPPEPEPTPAFGSRMGEPQSGHTYSQQYGARNGTKYPIAAALQQQEPEGEPVPAPLKYRTLKDVCPSVAEKPSGFITTDEALKLIDLSPESAKASLGTWVRKEQVAGVIWCSAGMTPTKGLPGRLMVKRADVIARDKLRATNKATMVTTGAGRWQQQAAE